MQTVLFMTWHFRILSAAWKFNTFFDKAKMAQNPRFSFSKRFFGKIVFKCQRV